ncbi:hypothetical protein BsWGS_16620 [Bradybaena similaris]
MSFGLEKRIELEMRGRPADQVFVLNLDNCKAAKVEGFNGNFTNLQMLSLINSGLQTLEGFPKFSNLKKLDLSDNRLSEGLDHLAGCSKLTHLILSGNNIQNIDILDGLKDLHCLQSLDLVNCEVTNIDQYREKVFAKLSQIAYLDGFDRDDQEEVDVSADDEDELSGEDSEDDSDEDDHITNGLDDEDEENEDSDDSEVYEDESSSARGTKRKLDNQTEDDDDDV